MISRPFRFFRAFLLLSVLAGVGTVMAAEKKATFGTQFRAWDTALAKIATRVQSGRTGSIEEKDLRQTLQDIFQAAVDDQRTAQDLAKQVKGLLDALGPAPIGEGQEEDKAVRSQRQKLNRDLAEAEGRMKQAGLVQAKAEQLVNELTRRSRERLKATLLERTVFPFNPKVWVVALPESVKLFEVSGVEAPTKWWSLVWNNPSDQTAFLRTLTFAVLLAIAGWLVGHWLRGRYGRVQGVADPSFGRRIVAGLVEGGGRALGPIILVLLAGTVVVDAETVEGPFPVLVSALTRSLVLFLLGYALINAAITPRRAEWRLLDFEEQASNLLVFRLKLSLMLFLGFVGVQQAVSWAKPSAELASVSALVFTVALTPVLFSLLSRKIWDVVADDGRVHHKVPRLRVLLTAILAVSPIAAILGYAGLAAFLLTTLVMSGLVLAGLGMLRVVLRESLAASLDGNRPFGRGVRDLLGLNPESITRTLFWFRALFDIALIIVAGLALLLVWGFGADETLSSAVKLFRGVQIGSYTLSLLDILIGLTVFALILFLTRSIQKGLDRHVLPNLSRDKGIRDALKTGVGYVGVVIAALVGISALGLDLTNLALIAGALSVGLGFGLQNVVNNFVSGLILLAERPIKPGDWIVINGHEGKVKQVNVRSTEIETFQRASVIMPNADLISSPVVNWTHKNILGRVEVCVGVAYGTDPEKVKEILLQVARDHPNVISYPESYVLFTDFADSSLNFELRAYLRDVEERLQTASDMRFAIQKAFADAGVEIPFPQRVVHMISENTPS